MNYEQISLFDEIQDSPDRATAEWAERYKKRLCVGDVISRVILGECEIGVVEKIEGNERYFFYRTTIGAISANEADTDIEVNIRKAEENRKNFVTIEPHDLTERISVRYSPRKCDGAVLTAQIGYFGELLFWKEDITYQFCETIPDMKKRKKRYDEIKEKILKNRKNVYGGLEILPDELPMARLYLRNSGLYAEARYSEPAIRREIQEQRH